MTFTINSFEARELNVGLITTELRPAHVASVELEGGDTITLSRFETEDYWVMDSHVKADGFPVMVNGAGSRITRVKTLRDDHPLAVELERRREAL